jgi:hypothetical protein
MADNQENAPRDERDAPTGKQDRAQVPPGAKTGTDTRDSDSAGGGGTVRGPGGPDTGSDAMPGQSNAL